MIEKQVGRPSKYEKRFNEQAYKLALLGATDSEIADFFEVSESTVNLWKLEYPQFSESIRGGKTKADAIVALKLFDRAIGAEWIEQQAFKCKTQTAPGVFTEDIKVVDVKCAAPPDTQAISLWLRNRKPERWKDKEITPAGNQTVNLIVIANTEQDGHTITLTPEASHSLPQQGN